MTLLKQDVIRKLLRIEGIKMSREELSDYLDSRYPKLSPLVIRVRGRGVDAGHTYRWYDILSPNFSQAQAHQHIVRHILQHDAQETP